MKKGISESKVQRMRNIVKGDYTKSVKTQFGYKRSDKNKIFLKCKKLEILLRCL